MKLGSAIRLRLTAVGLAGLAGISGATLALAQGQDSVLVSPDWLSANMARTNVRLIDLGKRAEEFEAAHLPGAQFVDWRTDLADPGNREHFGVLQPDAFEALMSRLERVRLQYAEVLAVVGIGQIGAPIHELGARQMGRLELLGALAEIDEPHVRPGHIG